MCEEDLSSCSCSKKESGQNQQGSFYCKAYALDFYCQSTSSEQSLHHQGRAGKADPLPKENTSDQEKAGRFYFDSLYYVVYPCFVLFCFVAL